MNPAMPSTPPTLSTQTTPPALGHCPAATNDIETNPPKQDYPLTTTEQGVPTPLAIPPTQATIDKLAAAMERLLDNASPPSAESQQSSQREPTSASRTPSSPSGTSSAEARDKVLIDAEGGDVFDTLTGIPDEAMGELDISSDELNAKEFAKQGSVYSDPLWSSVLPVARRMKRSHSLNSRNLRTISRPAGGEPSLSRTFDPVLPDDAMGNFSTPRHRTPLVRNTGTLAPHGSFTSRCMSRVARAHKQAEEDLTDLTSRPSITRSSTSTLSSRASTASNSNTANAHGLAPVPNADDREESQAEAAVDMGQEADMGLEADTESTSDQDRSTTSATASTVSTSNADADVEDEGLKASSDDMQIEATTSGTPSQSSNAAASSSRRSRSKGRPPSRRHESDPVLRKVSSSRDAKSYPPLSAEDTDALQHAASRGDQLAAYHLNERGPRRPPRSRQQQQPQIVTGLPDRPRRTRFSQEDHLLPPTLNRRASHEPKLNNASPSATGRRGAKSTRSLE